MADPPFAQPLFYVEGIGFVATPAAQVLSSYYASKRSLGDFVVTDPTYGALGDGVHDDGPAIQAAENDRAAFGARVDNLAGGRLIFPAGTYAISQELVTSATAAIWEGRGPSVTTIRAAVHLRSLLVNSSHSSAISGITFDANQKADYGVLRSGDSSSHYHHVACVNSLLDGFASIQNGAFGRSISAITQNGPGPTISIALSSVSYGQGYTTIIIKIGPGGTSYQTSFNGGSSYGYLQPIAPITNLASPSTFGAAAPGIDIGVSVLFSGTYQAGTTYTFTAINPGNNINDMCTFIECSASQCGRLFYTAGAFHAVQPVGTVVSGSVTTTSGSSIVVGSGTSFLSTRARCGDFIYIYGTNRWWQIICVLDDTHIALGSEAIANMTTFSGQDFIISVGSGLFDYRQTDANIQGFINCTFGSSCANGMCLYGVIGNALFNCNLTGVASVGLSTGIDDGGVVVDSAVVRPYFEPNNNVVAVALYNGSSGNTIIEPTNYNRGGGAGTEMVTANGVVYGGSSLRAQAEQLLGVTVPVTGDGQVIPAPDMGFSPTGNSLVFLSGSANHTISIAVPGKNGLRLTLINVGSATYTLTSPSASLASGSKMTFVSYAGAWY